MEEKNEGEGGIPQGRSSPSVTTPKVLQIISKVKPVQPGLNYNLSLRTGQNPPALDPCSNPASKSLWC